jgi:thiosulfate dehydrogenase [quinone] large subunit
MDRETRIWLAMLRVSLGWLMLYSGIAKIVDPTWTAENYARGAKTAGALYMWFAAPGNIGWINFLNEWGLALLGVSLVLGVGVRLSSSLGALLMLFYYLPVLDFPYAGDHGFIVDEHVIYALLLGFLAVVRAGRFYGLESWFGERFLSRWSRFRAVWG